MAKKITGLVLTLLLSVSAVAADQSWQLREVRRPQGSLDYCIADHALPDGRHINLALDPEGRMNLGLVLPKEDFAPEQDLTLKLQFDKTKPLTLQARAVQPTILLVDLPDADRWRTLWSKGRRLTVGGLPKKQIYKLQNPAAMLDDLSVCAAQQERALPPVMLDVLQRAGLADGLTLIPPPPGLGLVDFAWMRQGISGGSAAFAPQPDFRRAVRGQLAVLKNYCQGLWSEDMELIMVAGSAKLQQGVLSCNVAGSEEVMAIIFHAPGDGTARYYAHAGTGADRAAVIAAANALVKALIQKH